MPKTIDRTSARPADLPASAIADFSAGMQKLPHVLAQLGFSSLRPGQKDVVQTVMLGYDCVGILPTAAGKTATYVIPALCMGWRTIIISPLLALMADQEASMQRMGVAAARITSDVSPAQAQSVLSDWACGKLQIMLVSPERVSNPEWRAVIDQFPPDFLAMDECFPGDTYVPTEFGFRSMLDLWHTLQVGGVMPRVKSREADGSISWRKITNVFQNGRNPLMSVRLVGGGEVRCTPSHVWFTEAGERPAGTLRKGDRVFADSGSTSHKIRGLNADQMQLVIGSFLGDGGFQHVSVRAGTFRLAATHGIAQADYARWKMDALQGVVDPVARNGYAGKEAVRCRTCVFQLPAEGAPTTGNKWGKKTVVPKWMQDTMDSRALAIWAMDDGAGVPSPDGDLQGFVLSTNSFTKECVNELRAILLDKFGLESALLDHKGWSIRLCKAAATRLRELVRPYLFPDLLYKFNLTEANWGCQLHQWRADFAPYLMEVESVSEPAQNDEPTYDLEVEENHNYFVATTTNASKHRGYVTDTAVLVHNCHTFSNWADTFRAGYKFAGDFVRAVNPKVVLALSATMPPEMEEEVRAGLSIQNARRVFYYPTRTNLKLHTLDLKSATQFAPWVAANCPASSIVYCATRENVETVCADIQRYVRDREVVYYHGGITSPSVKKEAMDRWMYSEDAIMVATNAFGMGIDKATVRSVVHYDLPGTLSALAQECGRAGRDGQDSHCWAYPNPKSISTQKYFIRIGNPTEEDVRSVLRQFATMQDMDGTIHANRMVVAQRAGVDPKLMQAVMTFMYGERLVEEVVKAGAPAKLRWAASIPSFTPAEAQTRDALDAVSRDKDGWLEFDIVELSKQLGLKEPTVGSRLTSMAAKGLFTYVRQDSRKPIRIIGSPDNVDFTRINKKAAEAKQKLDEVVAYCDVPDEDKHTYLNNTMKTNAPAS